MFTSLRCFGFVWLLHAGVLSIVAAPGDEHWDSRFGLLGLDGFGVNRTVNAIASSGQNAYVGGFFSKAGAVNAANLVRWDGTNWSLLGQVNGPVHHIAVTSNLLYINGSFSEVNGVAASWVAKWDGTNWSALGNPPYDAHAAFAAQGERVYVADYRSGAPFGPYIYQWDGTNWGPLGGGIWGAWQPEVSMPVRAFAVSGTDVYVGGNFYEVGGVQVTNLARGMGQIGGPLVAEWTPRSRASGRAE